MTAEVIRILYNVEAAYPIDVWRRVGRGLAKLGYPEEAVTPAKQRTIRQVAAAYLSERGGSGGLACRFDVVAVLGDEITWIPDAF